MILSQNRVENDSDLKKTTISLRTGIVANRIYEEMELNLPFALSTTGILSIQCFDFIWTEDEVSSNES